MKRVALEVLNWLLALAVAWTLALYAFMAWVLLSGGASFFTNVTS